MATQPEKRADHYGIFVSLVDGRYFAAPFDDGARFDGNFRLLEEHACPEGTPEWPHCWEHAKALANLYNLSKATQRRRDDVATA